MYNNYGTFTADSATFTDNTASYAGGAVYNLWNLHCGQRDLHEQHCFSYGGAVCNCYRRGTFTDNARLTATMIIMIQAERNNGGGVQLWKLRCGQRDFTDNTASEYGGAKIDNGGAVCNLWNLHCGQRDLYGQHCFL